MVNLKDKKLAVEEKSSLIMMNTANTKYHRSDALNS